MTFSVRTGLGLLLVLTTSCGLQQQNKPNATQLPNIYETPVTVFDAWREAAAKRGWRSYFDCLTPQTQNNMMFELVFQLGLAPPEKKANFDAKKFFDDKSGPSFDQKFKEKFGIDHATFREKRFTDPNIKAMEAAEHQLLCDDIAERVRDKAGFFEAVSNLLDRGDYEPLGELKQVTVEGDTASGQAEAVFKHWSSDGHGTTKEVRERQDRPFHFRKVNGKWLIEF